MNMTYLISRHEFTQEVKEASYIIMALTVPLLALLAIGIFRLVFPAPAQEVVQAPSQPTEGYVGDPNLANIIIPGAFALLLGLSLMLGATALLAQTSQLVRQHNCVHRIPEVAAAKVRMLLHQGNLAAASHLAQAHDLPISQARVHLAQGDPSTALAVLGPLRQQMEAKGWEDERLKVMVLQMVAHHAHGEKDKAVQLLGDALAPAEPGGFICTFVDEGSRMIQPLSKAVTRGVMPDYTGKLLVAFKAEKQRRAGESPLPTSPSLQPPIEPLSQRELEVLQLIAQGLSNREIGGRLFLALSTVKVHNGNIYGRLQVQRRTEAVARARELGLL